MRALVFALVSVLTGCATQTVIVQPAPARPVPVGVAPMTVIVPVARVTPKVKYKKVYVYGPGRKHKKGQICAYEDASGTLTFTDKCPSL